MKIDERKYLLSLTNDVFDEEARVYAADGGVFTFDNIHDRKMKEKYLGYLDHHDFLDTQIPQLLESNANELKSVDWSRNMGKTRTKIGDHSISL